MTRYIVKVKGRNAASIAARMVADLSEPIRHPSLTTRAAPPEQQQLEDDLRERAAALFRRLVDDYPIDAISASIGGKTPGFTAISAAVGEWFESNPGEAWTEELQDTIVDHYIRTFNTRGKMTADELGLVGAFDLKNPEMIQSLQDLGAERVTGINDETKQRLTAQLVEGSEAGEGVVKLGERLRTVMTEMSERRSELIAATETATAWGIASQESYERNGIEQKRWISTRDAKTTEECRANDAASPIAIDAEFPSGDAYPPRFPGCRCSLAPVIEGYETPSKPWMGE